MRQIPDEKNATLFLTSGAVFIPQLFAITVIVCGNRKPQCIPKIQSMGCVNGR